MHACLLPQDASCSELLTKLKEYVEKQKNEKAAEEEATVKLNRYLHEQCCDDNIETKVDLTDIKTILQKVTCICRTINGRRQQLQSCDCVRCDTCLGNFLRHFVQHNIEALYMQISKVGIYLCRAFKLFLQRGMVEWLIGWMANWLNRSKCMLKARCRLAGRKSFFWMPQTNNLRWFWARVKPDGARGCSHLTIWLRLPELEFWVLKLKFT